jgi:hypothetical protein
MEKFSLFATPVFIFDVPDMAVTNEEVAALLLTEQQASSGLARSNVGGWHSPPTLAQRTEPCYQSLMRMFVDHVSLAVTVLAKDAGQPQNLRYSLHAWAMIMRQATIPPCTITAMLCVLRRRRRYGSGGASTVRRAHAGGSTSGRTASAGGRPETAHQRLGQSHHARSYCWRLNSFCVGNLAAS